MIIVGFFEKSEKSDVMTIAKMHIVGNRARALGKQAYVRDNMNAILGK